MLNTSRLARLLALGALSRLNYRTCFRSTRYEFVIAYDDEMRRL